MPAVIYLGQPQTVHAIFNGSCGGLDVHAGRSDAMCAHVDFADIVALRLCSLASRILEQLELMVTIQAPASPDEELQDVDHKLLGAFEVLCQMLVMHINGWQSTESIDYFLRVYGLGRFIGLQTEIPPVGSATPRDTADWTHLIRTSGIDKRYQYGAEEGQPVAHGELYLVRDGDALVFGQTY